jgi:uncharacterized protein YjiK
MNRFLFLAPLRFALGSAVLLAGCTSDGEPLLDTPATEQAASASAVDVADRAAAPASLSLPYDFAAASATFELPEALREISGLALLPDGRLAAVQDETGVLYTLDAATGAIVEERTFAGAGDYEDVEHADGAVWVLMSNGTLIELPDGDGPAREHDTPLKGKCDAEGLALDAARSRLLIACKEDPGEGLDEDAVRAVYAFDLGARALDTSPAYVFDRRTLDARDDFKPSALAIRPGTAELYVLSSVRNALAVVGADGRVASVVELPEATNAQPEGLAFAPDGTLFLSNEGPEGPATLQRFDTRP